jgi:pyridoxamine 5'-phosphate oxidase
MKTNAPQIRIDLLKEYSLNGFVFFTNYDSKKGKELINNNNASILFFWESLHRQIRIQGKVEKIDRKDTIEYFNSRPYESRIGAIASNQSSHLESREILEKRYQDLKQKYPENPPCPENWGGFILKPNSFEFWQGRESRLHDRIVYELINNDWKTKRLYP